MKYTIVLEVESDLPLDQIFLCGIPETILTDIEDNTPSGWAELRVLNAKVVT